MRLHSSAVSRSTGTVDGSSSPPRLVAAALIAFALIAPTGAQAAPAWLAPEDLSARDQLSDSSQVAVDREGSAVVVWRRFAPSYLSASSRIVQAAIRPAGGSWSQLRNLSVAGQNADSPRVAVDPVGNAVAVWQRFDGSNYIVQAATRPAGGGSGNDGWSHPQDLSAAGQNAESPQVAIDAVGNAVAVWQRFDGSNHTVQAATRPAGGGSRNDGWRDAQDVSSAGRDAKAPQAAVDAEGNAVAVWQDSGTVDVGGVIQAATRPRGGGPVKDGWSTPQDLSAASDDSAEGPQVAVDPDGNAVAVWLRSDGVDLVGDVRFVVQAASRPAGGGPVRNGWTEPTNLSGNVSDGEAGQRVAVDSQGNAVAIWTSYTSSTNPAGLVTTTTVVQAATRRAGGEWRDAQNISDPLGAADSPQLAFDPQGNAVAVWRRSSGVNPVIEAARRHGGSWGEPRTISGADVAHTSRTGIGGPEVALDVEGNALAVWPSRNNVNESMVQVAGYDAAGPQLRELRIPGTGHTGSPLSFSVVPLDVWSDVTFTGWDFGDGASAVGKSASHSYAASGRYEVTVTATDSLGNSSSEKRTVVITASGGGGPGLGGAGGGLARGTVTGSGAAQRRGGAPGLSAGERARAAALRRCLARARRSSTRTRRRALKRRCLVRYGRAPGRVGGLRARALSPTKIALSFRAARSGDRSAPAGRYLIKQSTRRIRGRPGFRRARSLCGGRCRVGVSRAGERVRLTITDLRSETTYYYAVAARDNVSGRLGPRSRVVRVTTR